ncbi:peptide chain release factor N(5)-glutamine methyltransferase [Suttonella ornithocola]|uniref:Release factor glutamine methyltransferase n=1 Tax=Suttonella ornithocola TaxID=279832 RepID=A0A380MMB5_9GAMM|nr:peptide chain release factor N(5)-glutamine methyltransferase [Suttonella ornithocola]SUO93750.1 Release factor glutamine methyltransferase [Suttonella ornithocola]
MPYLSDFLAYASEQLKKSSESPSLDAALLIEAVTAISPTSQKWRNDELTQTQIEQLEGLLQRRLQGEPMAYLLGNQPFYDIKLKVTPATLIPRPDTEHLVEAALARIPKEANWHIADLGTGSGAIAIAIAKHRPNAQVVAVDNSAEALAIAQENVQLNTDKTVSLKSLQFQLGSWFEPLEKHRYHLIVSNPPYITSDDRHLAALQYEPRTALVAENEGYADLFYLIENAGEYLCDKGWLLLEHGYQQAARLREYAQQYSHWKNIATLCDYGNNERITLMQKRI